MAGDWQQSYRRVPPHIAAKVEGFEGPFVVFRVRRITPEEVGAGTWDHLGITLDDDGSIAVPEHVLPDTSAGGWAHRNQEGWVLVRRDLPKITRTYTWEVPNWGDWSRGSHTQSQDREVYQREVHAAPGWGISMETLRADGDGADILFQLDPVFEADGDQDELLFAVNVFQESVGVVDVRPSDEPADAYVQTLNVAWEILPPGNVDEVVRRVAERLQPTEQEATILEERLRFLAGLRPESYVSGTSGFARYFGALFGNDFVAFENLRYGNALYVMYDNWAELSQWSRRELLQSDEDYVRIPHAGTWRAQFRALLTAYRRRRRRRDRD